MIELLAVLGGVTGLGGLGATIVLALKLSAAKDAQVAASEDHLRAERLADTYRDERDALSVANVGLTAERDSLSRQLTATQAALANARKELVDHVKARLESASDADVARIVDGLLGKPLPGAGEAGAGDDRRAATGVSPADAAAADPAGARADG